MKITIYELLGMIKDCKAPSKIKYINSIWKYDKETKDYFHDDLWLIYSMNSIGLTEREVEIIEESQEHKIPDKIDVNHLQQIKKWKRTKILGNKINEILDYLEVNND